MFICCFSLAPDEVDQSFSTLITQALPEIRQHAGEAFFQTRKLILVGTKSDLKDPNDKRDYHQEFKAKLQISTCPEFIECSAKEDDNIDQVFRKTLSHYLEEPELQKSLSEGEQSAMKTIKVRQYLSNFQFR